MVFCIFSYVGWLCLEKLFGLVVFDYIRLFLVKLVLRWYWVRIIWCLVGWLLVSCIWELSILRRMVFFIRVLVCLVVWSWVFRICGFCFLGFCSLLERRVVRRVWESVFMVVVGSLLLVCLLVFCLVLCSLISFWLVFFWLVWCCLVVLRGWGVF